MSDPEKTDGIHKKKLEQLLFLQRVFFRPKGSTHKIPPTLGVQLDSPR